MTEPYVELAESSAGYRQFTIGESTMTESEHVVSRFDLAELTDDRAAKIEAMAEAIQRSLSGIIKAWEEGTSDPYTLDNLELDARDMATAALGALQLWSLDALLDSVHPDCYIDGMKYIDRQWYVWLMWPRIRMWDERRGTGSTRMEAIADAVAKAKGERR